MWGLLIIALSGLSAGGGIVVGAAWMRNRLAVDPHEHAWGQWEDCELRDHWRWNADRSEMIPVLVAGQQRECLGCGERQVRRVRECQ
jgi:hypothetical protein